MNSINPTLRSFAPDTAFRSAFERTGRTTFAGHAFNPKDLDRKYVVELLVDGAPLHIVRAQDYDPSLSAAKIGDGCYGFSFQLHGETVDDSAIVEARLANTGISVGAPIFVDAFEVAPESAPCGLVEWLGGLRFAGWLAEREVGSNYVNVMVDNDVVAQAQMTRWRNALNSANGAKAVPGFDLHLSSRFADGIVRQVRFVEAAGEELSGSPVKFVAFADGLQAAIAKLGQIETERLRGELFDRLVPMSLPFSDYRQWRQRFPLPKIERPSAAGPVAVILVGDGDVPTSLKTLEAQTAADWTAFVLPASGLDQTIDCVTLKAFLQNNAPECQAVIFALAGTGFESTMIERFAQALGDFPEARIVYGDLSVTDATGLQWPIALPAFDYERMLEQGYGAYLFAARRADVDQMLAARNFTLYSLFNSLAGSPAQGGERVVHLPQGVGSIPDIDLTPATDALILAAKAHLLDRGIDARVSPAKGAMFPAIHVLRLGERKTVSIMIPVRNRADLLRSCLATIASAVAKSHAELIIIDNDSSDPETLTFLRSIEDCATVLRVPGPFNFARLNNLGAEVAKGEALCLLNNDIEAQDDGWLDEMLGRLAEDDVGAVGAMLVWPSGIVQHGGVVLGSSLSAGHAFSDRMAGDPGYTDLLRVAHECSAVTAACLLTPRADYMSVGGLDEAFFPVNYNDIDYCLKLRARGKRIIFTPHARLIHNESSSRGKDVGADRVTRFQRELRLLRARWLEALVADPFYNPTLSLDPLPFSALAWPPRSVSARLRRAPPARDVPPGM